MGDAKARLPQKGEERVKRIEEREVVSSTADRIAG